MKLATVVFNGPPVVAVVDAERSLFWPLHEIVPEWLPHDRTDMVFAISQWSRFSVPKSPAMAGHTLSSARLLAPILAPPHNIMCVGKNYHSHAREFSRSGYDAGNSSSEAIPQHPIVFTKPATAICGPGDVIPLWPGLDEAVDYEAELAVVIGKKGRFILRENALDYVFGYTIINDVTARDLQRDHKQWFLGKAIDGFAPVGPWIVTSDELDVRELRISCRVNGELRQDANTSELIFDVPTLIETISRSVTLHPGDLIATGTPEGVGIGFKPPKFLMDTDVVEIEISGIGTLRNTVRRAST